MIQCVAKKSNPNSDRSRWCSFSGRTPYPRGARCNAADNSPLALTIREERQIVISLLPDWIDRRGEAHPAHGDRHDPGPRERNFSRRRGRASRRTRRRPRPRSARKFRAGRPRLATAGNGRPPRTMANCRARGLSERRPGEFRAHEKSGFATRGTRSVTAGYAGNRITVGLRLERRTRIELVFRFTRSGVTTMSDGAGGPPGECGWRLRLD